MSLGLILLASTSSFAQGTVAPTLPNINTFLWGNTAVNAPGQTSFVSGSGWGYRYLTPATMNPGTKYPVIIFLCGEDETGTDNNLQLSVANGTANGVLNLVSIANPNNQANYPCFFIAPQPPLNTSWSSDAAATAIQNLLAIMEAQYPNSFDTTRIYLTGLSDGGVGAYDLPFFESESKHMGFNPFAATVPMSGQLGYGTRANSTEPFMPIWAFHAANDPDVPIATSDDVTVPALRALGFPVVYTRYLLGMHDVWQLAYQEPQLLPWMFAQQLGQTTQAPLSGFAITGDSFSSSLLSLSGTTSSPEAFTGVSWTNPATGQSGNALGSVTPSWSIPNIPLATGANAIQVTATAPTYTGIAFATLTNYGGALTVNIPYTASPSGVTNVALNKPVTVSSTDYPGDAGANAVDGDATTRWSSAYSDPQYMVIDLGANYDIDEIDLDWQTACGYNYLIQTSTDDFTWTTRTSVFGNTSSGVLAYDYSSPPSARYVRIYGTQRATPWGYSLWEVAVYSSGLTATSPTSPTQPVTTTPSNVALNKTVTASSMDYPGDAAVNAVDGNVNTRWSSAYSDPQWITVDLGSNYDINEVDLNWQSACGSNYLIQTSLDNFSWTTQTTVVGNTSSGLLQYPYSSPITCRYVRMYGTQRATGWGYSLWEFAVIGIPSSTTTTTPTGPTNLALNQPVTVSSTDYPGDAGADAVDGNTNTRWSSAYSDPQWIEVDLGASHSISEIDLNWQTACGYNYLIQTSTDNVNWTTQNNVVANTTAGLIPYVYATPITARYVRMYGTQRATQWGYSLWEFAVYGE